MAFFLCGQSVVARGLGRGSARVWELTDLTVRETAVVVSEGSIPVVGNGPLFPIWRDEEGVAYTSPKRESYGEGCERVIE